jgi:predicted transcriptional regulator
MEVKISPELQEKLDRIAAQQGRDRDSLVQETLERLVDYDEWFVREVEKGLEQIQNGEVVEHDEIVERMEGLIAQKHRNT